MTGLTRGELRAETDVASSVFDCIISCSSLLTPPALRRCWGSEDGPVTTVWVWGQIPAGGVGESVNAAGWLLCLFYFLSLNQSRTVEHLFVLLKSVLLKSHKCDKVKPESLVIVIQHLSGSVEGWDDLQTITERPQTLCKQSRLLLQTLWKPHRFEAASPQPEPRLSGRSPAVKAKKTAERSGSLSCFKVI